MKRMRSAVVAALAGLAAAPSFPLAADAATTPPILTGKGNQVPACVTPERLMAFIELHNKKLLPKFREVAADYKKHGEELHVRWDYAFYQMIVETNYLKFTSGDTQPGAVSPAQNNFAGMGATGHHVPGESFASVDAGVEAHLDHIRLYSGEPVENPVAQRTKMVEDLILPWAQGLKRPVTFTDLTHKWAPGGNGYSNDIEGVGELFRQAECSGAAANEQTAEAAPAADATTADDAPAAPVAKAPAKPAPKLAAAAPVKKAAPPAAPAAPAEPVLANASDDQAAPADAELAGPALRKNVKVATVKINTPAVIPDEADDSNGDGAQAEGATSIIPDPASKPAAPKAKITVTAPAAPAVKKAPSPAAIAVATVAPAASKTVKVASADASKLPVAATVTAPAADDQQADTSADGSGDGEGGAVEVKQPPVTKQAAAPVRKTVAAATPGDVAAATGSAKAKAGKLESAELSPDAAGTTSDTAAGNTHQASMTVPARVEPVKNCKVFTASYGGGKSLLIRSPEGDHTRFTALTVNEAKAESQAKAFINVYAKGGQTVGEFGTQNEALTKAFELCPES